MKRATATCGAIYPAATHEDKQDIVCQLDEGHDSDHLDWTGVHIGEMIYWKRESIDDACAIATDREQQNDWTI